MTGLQNLSKILDKYESQLGSTEAKQFELLKGLPFYSEWNRRISPTKQAQTDFNHAIGLPQKNGQSYPLFDYEQRLYDTLQKHKHVWIKKATGLGVTEFMLRYMAWLCFNGNAGARQTTRISSDNQLETSAKSPAISGSQMCIVTGPRIELAITLIDRMKGLFQSERVLQRTHRITFDSKETVIELNGCHIEAYPSHHLDAMRNARA